MTRRPARDRVVSVRLTAAEHAQLRTLGLASAVLRRLIGKATRDVADTALPPPSEAAGRVSVVWWDGTCGPTWPAPASR